MIKRLVCVASALIDLVLDVPNLPPRGGDVLGVQRDIAVGGAFNVVSVAARLGLESVYGGPHGTGPFGDRVRAALATEGIAVVTGQNPDLDTGWTVALIEPDGERTFVTVTGADGIVEPADLSAIEYRDGDAVYVSGYDLAYEHAGAAIAEHVAQLPAGVFVAFDPGPLAGDIAPERMRRVLERAGLVSLNEREAAIVARGVMRPDSVVIVRQGARGATLHEPGQAPVHVPATPVAGAAGTSGAGDTHVAATLVALARGMGWPDAIAYANREAASRLRTIGSTIPRTSQLEG